MVKDIIYKVRSLYQLQELHGTVYMHLLAYEQANWYWGRGVGSEPRTVHTSLTAGVSYSLSPPSLLKPQGKDVCFEAMAYEASTSHSFLGPYVLFVTEKQTSLVLPNRA